MRLLRDLVDELLHAKVNAQLFGGDRSPKLGRLVLRERIGAGAMGTVFEAFDPRLERAVAVKVLRADVDAQRVLAEARALAKLQHPNVVAVYDADEVDGLVYIVMEHIAGNSLRAWVGTSLGWRDVARMMREAAAGIAAAHAAGLVHRDIKPDNILVDADPATGRARVVDFGLAHVQLADDGTSAGTPFYMAPEVLAGGAATAASDQFSFGVTLFEALYGKRPHAALPTGEAATERATSSLTHRSSRAQLLDELRTAAGTASTAPRPAGSDVPAWLHTAVQRMLAADPGQRFDSMTDVVAALRPPRRRSRALVFAGIGLALGATVGVVAYRHAASSGDSCTGGPTRVATAWSPDTRAKIEKAFAGTPWLGQTLAALDGKAIDWQTTYRHVCQATKRGEQSGALLDLRMRCLDRELDRFAALTSELSAADPASRIAAPAAISEIDAATCERLTDPGELALPADATERAKVREQQRAIDRAQALFSLGRYPQARDALPPQDAVTLPRLRAERLALAASIEARIGNPDAARQLLDQALLAAAEASAPHVELDVWSRRLRNELFAGSPAKVLEWENFARAAAKRANLEGAELDGIIGEALRNAGQLARAKLLLERASQSTDPLRPEQRALIAMNLGSVELATGHSAKALELFTEARDTVLTAFGDKHPDLALYDDKLAAAYRAQGKLRKALDLHAQSLALRTAAFGETDRAVATSLLYRAQTELEAGDVFAADADATKAKAIREKVYGAKSPRLGEVIETQAEITQERGAPELAQQQFATAASLDPRLTLAALRGRGFDGANFALAAIKAKGVTGADFGEPEGAPSPPLLAADELLSIDLARTYALWAHAAALAKHAPEAKDIAAALRARLPADADLALVVPIGEALVDASDSAAATELLAAAAKRLSNEPTRTGLRLMIAYAKASQDPQVARTAVSLYQALPKLDRTDYDAIWALSTRTEN